MRLAFTAAKLFSVWLLFILLSDASAFGQSTANPISISLSVSSSEFSKKLKPRAFITVVNRSGEAISLDSIGRIGLELVLKGRPVTFCRIDECYSAAAFPRGGTLANNASTTLVVKLYDLYWHNKISSIDLTSRNLFTHVPPGEYELFAEISEKADNWKAEDPRYISLKSNVVSPVTISRGK